MYSYFNGVITEVNSTFIVLDVNNIGYEIKTPNPFYFHLNTEVKIHCYLYVREDTMDIYGFATKEEKALFTKLLSVKGIGPKSALAVIASGSVAEIQNAIERSDDKYLTKFPGIGPKAAMQIVLDLKGKVNFIKEEYIEDTYLDVIEALISLGYKKKDVDKIIGKLPKGLNESDAVKEALKLL